MRWRSFPAISADPLIDLDWRTCALSRFIWSPPGSWPSPNQTVCALRFFYGVTLGYTEIPERIVYARKHP